MQSAGFQVFQKEKIFQSLIKDLKDLEVSGITLPDGQVFLGTLTSICGDNLRSHCIGRYVENFSKSLKFCRYCNIDRETLREDPLSKGTNRTVESYREHVERDGASSAVEGIKLNSLFNSLRHFHVCQAGLPPCLGHDIFEGVASYDVALYIKHLVTVDKQFTYQELNQRVIQFTYFHSDANGKPVEVAPGRDKLSGHAVQNWCLLRMLPVLTAEIEVLQRVLQLRQICVICVVEPHVKVLLSNVNF